MPDFDVEANCRLLVAIADGYEWLNLRALNPGLTEAEFSDRKRFVENCQAQHANAWKTWSEADIQTLRGMHYHGASVAEIAAELGRSESAVEFLLPPPRKRSA